MKMRRRMTRTAAIALSAALVASCGSSGEDSGGGGEALNVQVYQAPDTFSPLISQVGGNQLVQSLHWDALLGLDDKGEFEPRLAESWKVSDDGLVWTFDLRDGVKWSDGKPFTASDVVFSYNLYANPKSGSQVGRTFADVKGYQEVADGKASQVAGLTAPDDDTFVMTLKSPNAGKLIDLVEPLHFVLPKHVYSKLPVKGLATSTKFREPTVGVGPYVFSRWVNDDQIEFKANPEYRNKPAYAKVYATYAETDQAQAQLRSGELHYAQVAPADAASVEKLDGVELTETPGVGIMALHNAWDTGKFKDVRVRQAILHAIDRKGLVKDVIKGHGRVVPAVQFGPEWAVPKDLPTYDYNPAKAKSLLKQAGWDSSTKVNLEIVPGPKDREQVLSIVAAQLKAVGINAAVKKYDAAGMSKVIGDRKFDLMISGYGVFNLEPSALNVRLTCDAGALSGYCNKDVDESLIAGMSETEEGERAPHYAKAQQLIAKDVPIFQLYSPNTLAAVNEQVKGFKLNPLPTQAFWNIAEWKAQ